ncbi:helix-turn-helix transcriptional regulator [Nonomuraea bangladeshensis]|jgi:DNA-binding phage protein|uniref:Helix-turn-helix transcriptional regulator n=1 Tax=Nonomuraea bangladeshensis TaxID=404385 RepID=A0ABV3H3V3_9ACTN|nr:helix-turn-helix transcriptional regulator [Nonomuraea sp. LP-02]MED7926646.1 helix-turn-helix transcriptional regulator [Nonomuraea sp. LP-02]
MMGHSRWETYKAKRLREMEADAQPHAEYEQAGRDLELGDQLREIRKRRGLSQKVVAERAGMSQPALSRIEGGGGIPDIATLLRLGAAMGVRFRVELVVDDDTTEIEPLTVHHRQLANA